MEKKLYYEKTNVARSPEVEDAYKYAVENNYKFYRAVTQKGMFYGIIDGRCTKAVEGQEWFKNDKYIEPSIEPTEEPTRETMIIVEEIPEQVQEAVLTANEEVAEPVENGVDYKTLYEEAATELEQYKVEYNSVKKELDEIKNAFVTLAKELNEAKNKVE